MPNIDPVIDYREIFPFELDNFQQQAISALDAGKSVVVCAPTGSGKTIVGEYAIYRAISRKKRVFYTTPLKALSNQKFRDFQEKLYNWSLPGKPFAGEDNLLKEVGLITGDILINPDARVVVMTTEIFRNMLYETPIGQVGTSLEDVESVVLDECHYISDRGRGTVWEESIIYCPPQIQLVALSATIGNPEQLTEWINEVRYTGKKQYHCQLINSNFRPVPLRFYFSDNKGLYSLLNEKQNKINPKLKGKSKGEGHYRYRIECPSIETVIEQLKERDMLPAIYVIFSRRGCDKAVKNLTEINLLTQQESDDLFLRLLEFLLKDNYELQNKVLEFCELNNPYCHKIILNFVGEGKESAEELLQYFRENPLAKAQILLFLSKNSWLGRGGQLEALTRGVAAHHAGLLPAWKELVEKLFELGLVKIVFATATLSAGINMPARTTVISALKKRSDDGHRLLTSSEFLQIAGRAGRRGMDKVGHVVTVQTPFEGAKEAAILATAKPDPLRSWFTPTYGMVLNLLQKHTLDEIKSLLEKSFAEYLAQLKLDPEEKAIAFLMTELARLDIELASVNLGDLNNYKKLRELLKEEDSLLEMLEQQAQAKRRKDIAPFIPKIEPGKIIELKGKHKKTAFAVTAVLIAKIPSSGQAPYLLGLGIDNRWYIARNSDVVDINLGFIPLNQIVDINLPQLEEIKLGKGQKGDTMTAQVAKLIKQNAVSLEAPPEVIQQQKVIQEIKDKLANHPLLKTGKNPETLLERYEYRQVLKDKLHKTQAKYQKDRANSSYYWEEFLSLIEVLREFNALDGLHPTPLGEAAATIRGENELWLGLALMSGELDYLAPHHLAGTIAALITETPRPDSWTKYQPSREVFEALGLTKREDEEVKTTSLWETRRKLNQVQSRYKLALPVWLESKFIGLVEQWALGEEWYKVCENTSLDEGDLVRIFRRTVDVLWQIPQIPGISKELKENAKIAISAMKRFPISIDD